MYTYSAFNLGIQSDFPLPELILKQGNTDINIRLTETNVQNEQNMLHQSTLKLDKHESILFIKSVGTFIIRDGCEIYITPTPGVNIRRIRRYLVGSVMSILLYQRGYLVLHASTVDINNQAVSFVGFAGSGKSSLAAALFTRGYRVLADDISAIDIKNGHPIVLPGFPQLKLSLESANRLGLEVNNSMLLDNTRDKYGFRIHEGFTDIPLPLRQVYILEENPQSGIQPISAQTAVIKYISCSIPTLWTQIKDSNHFTQCVELANHVLTYSVKRESSIKFLPKLAQLIENHLISY